MNVWRRLTALFNRRSRFERDMADELRFHLDRRADDLVASGVSPAEARRRAALEFGGLERYKEHCRDARGVRLLLDLRADILYATRWLRRSPAFAGAALLSLALGIGANTLVFSAVTSLLLRPFPIERPAEVVFLETSRMTSHSFPLYRDIRDRSSALAGVAGYRITPMNLGSAGGAVRIWGYLATGNYFDLLGVKPLKGRFFHQDDDRVPGASPYLVLSFDCWTSRFLADERVIGQPVSINGRPFTVLGVAPQGFSGTERVFRPDVWVPVMMQAEIEGGNAWLDNRATSNLWINGRLKPGTSVAQTEAELGSLATDLTREYPNYYRSLSFRLTRPGLMGDSLGWPVRRFAWGLQLLAALVLLLACLNLAAVLLARGSDRHRELAIRLSIGAGRERIVRQLLTEAMVLSVAGGVLGVALATLGAQLIGAWRAPVDFPVSLDVHLDASVLAFAVAMSIVSGAIFGLAPARQAARTNTNAALKNAATSSEGGRRRWPVRDVLVGAQVALCCVLVSACLLSVVGLRRALDMPLGFEPRGVTMIGLDFGLSGYDQRRAERFRRDALDAIAAVPGIDTAAYSNSVPLSIDQSTMTFRPDDAPDASASVRAFFYRVSPGFFKTLGVRLLAGREFDWQDGPDAPRVAVVNKAFARSIVQADDPVGRRFRFGDGRVEVVGLVEDGKYQSLTESTRPAVFWSMLQSYNPTTTILARSTLPVDRVLPAMRDVVGRLDPTLPVYGAGSLDEMLGFALFPNRAAAVLLGFFGFVAIGLAAAGLHGIVSYAVARREREIGIRVAIGATPLSVLRLVLGRVAMLVAIGGVAGLAVVVAAADVLSAIVMQASARDPLTIAAVVVGMTVIAAVSAWAPSRRALRLNVTNALRGD